MRKILWVIIIAFFSISLLISSERVFAGSRRDLNNGDQINIRYRIVCKDKKGNVPYDGGQLIFAIKPFPFGIDWLGGLLNTTIKDLNLLPPFDVNQNEKIVNYTLDSSWPKGPYYLRYYSNSDKPDTRNVLTINSPENPRGYTDPLLDDLYIFDAGPCPEGYKPPQNSDKPAGNQAPAIPINNTSNNTSVPADADKSIEIDQYCDNNFDPKWFFPLKYCKEVAKNCVTNGNNKEVCLEKGKQAGVDIQELTTYCNDHFAATDCFGIVMDCIANGEKKEVCREAGKQVGEAFIKDYCSKVYKTEQEIRNCITAATVCLSNGQSRNYCMPPDDGSGKTPSSDDPAKFIEYLKSLFKDEAQLACEGKDPNWQVIYPDYKPALVDRCVGNATGCYNSGILDAFKNKTSGQLPAKCIEQALNLNMSLQPPTDGTITQPTVTNPQTIDDGSTTPNTGTGEAEPNEGEQPGQGSPRENPAEGQPKDETIVDVPTKITPFIFGRWEGSTINIANIEKGRITVGARLTPVSVPEGANWTTDDCIRDEVSLTLRKTQGEEIKISKERADGSGEKDENLAEGKFQNCQSYWASIDGPGTYTLTAIYNGGEEGRYNFLPAPVSGNQVTVIDGKEAIKTESKINVKVNTTSNKQTKARTLLAGKFGKDQRVVWKTQSSNVAGIKVEQQGDSYVATPDANSEERLVLTPEIQIEGRDLTASQNEIPTVSFSVVKVTNSGENLPLFNMPNYPNGQSKIFSEADLGDLNSINHIEATVTGTDLNSEYEIKPEDIRIDVNPSGTPVAEATFVKLTTDPLIYEIFPGTTKVTITASTNRVVQNPLFESTVNGVEQNSLAAQESSDNCADGTGICEYSYTFYQPGPGTYSLTFKNGDASDRVDFTINSKETVEEATSLVEFLYKGEKINSDDFITLDLGENVFERVIHSSNGDIRQSFTIIVEDTSEPEPGQTQLSWFCEGDLIIQEENGNRTINKDCASEGKSCRQVDTPGYDSDAECYTPEPSTEQKLSELKWYCDGNIIIQDANGNVTIHYDCSEQGQTCRAKTDTPGYPVDAECYVSDEPNDELTPQPQSNSLKWYCDGNIIIEDQNGNTRVNRDCGAEGLSCRLIDSPPGYESDAECYSQEQSSDTSGGLPQESYIYWYCEGEMIKQNENGNVTDHYDCAEYGQYCRLIDTLGYSSDAECYIP